LLEGNSGAPWRESVFAEMQMTTHLVRTPQYKYVKFYKKSGDFERPFLTASGEPAVFSPARAAEYQAYGYSLLFDLRDDPWEMRNLAEEARFAGVVKAHDEILRRDFEAKFIPGRHYDRN
jgi:hypothetical protein